MDIRVETAELTKFQTEAIVIGVFEGIKKPEGDLALLNTTLKNSILKLIIHGQLKGKQGEITFINTLGKLTSEFVVLVGLGKEKDFNTETLRGIVGELCRFLRQKQIQSIAIETPITDITPELSGQAITEGAIMGLYTFRKHITKEPEYGEIKTLTIIVSKQSDAAKVKKGINTGRIMAQAANLARDMVNEPSNFMTPVHMAEVAEKIAHEHYIELTVLEQKEMQKLGMGALLGVSQGSANAPRFIILKYKGRQSEDIDLALIGKGITFDTGGISLKPSDKMEDMKGDMAGGASVLSAISAIAQLKPRINVVAIVAAVENMPGGRAYKPGDVVKAMNGKTIEVISTDAEGRLTLADALSYVNIKVKPKNIVDVATLTGACVIALGNVCSAVFSNNQPLVEKLKTAAAKSGELTWQMPMFKEYKEQNKSDIADMKNVGGRPAGSITAAQFLAEFACDTPWIHMDIAGVDLTEKERAYYIKGATGIPVRTLVNLALDMAHNK
jgi:leucyl aminopeptidase